MIVSPSIVMLLVPKYQIYYLCLIILVMAIFLCSDVLLLLSLWNTILNNKNNYINWAVKAMADQPLPTTWCLCCQCYCNLNKNTITQMQFSEFINSMVEHWQQTITWYLIISWINTYLLKDNFWSGSYRFTNKAKPSSLILLPST